ncbi:glycosyltransferase family A protein [Lutimonas vermicola]|uniref:Glycosyltransferase family A protein n=1 Tax=Lutimonas vermicola TaxID=414288 RepID=A0ABU9L4U7_9FLAO
MNNYYFTVFTPSYNRRHTLTRLYKSLEEQSFKNFEWLILDDGSDDGTKELIEGLKRNATFPIRYKWVTNRGKHKVKNIGVKEAHGLFFFNIDSDDWLEPHTLERFKYHYESIPEESRSQFSGVAGLTRFAGKGVTGKAGDLNGIKNPEDIMDTDMISIREKYKVRGEKCGCHLTSVMRKFPWPEFDNEKFSPEALIWRRMAKEKYLVRYVNEIYRNQEIQKGGLSDPKMLLKRIVYNPKGEVLRQNEEIPIVATFQKRIRAVISYSRCSFHARYSLRRMVTHCNNKKLLVVGIPVGFLIYLNDKRKLGKEHI